MSPGGRWTRADLHAQEHGRRKRESQGTDPAKDVPLKCVYTVTLTDDEQSPLPQLRSAALYTFRQPSPQAEYTVRTSRSQEPIRHRWSYGRDECVWKAYILLH